MDVLCIILNLCCEVVIGTYVKHCVYRNRLKYKSFEYARIKILILKWITFENNVPNKNIRQCSLCDVDASVFTSLPYLSVNIQTRNTVAVWDIIFCPMGEVMSNYFTLIAADEQVMF